MNIFGACEPLTVKTRECKWWNASMNCNKFSKIDHRHYNNNNNNSVIRVIFSNLAKSVKRESFARVELHLRCIFLFWVKNCDFNECWVICPLNNCSLISGRSCRSCRVCLFLVAYQWDSNLFVQLDAVMAALL